MHTIYLVRHGRLENPRDILYGRLPVPLSQEGINQAERGAAWLAKYSIEHIYSSPVHRCRQTSTILADRLGVSVTYDQRLLELLTVMQGMMWQEIDALPQGRDAFQFVPELGGESMMEVRARMMECIAELAAGASANIVVCSHGHPLHLLYLGLSGQTLPEDSRELEGPEYQPMGSIRPVEVDGHVIRPREFVEM